MTGACLDSRVVRPGDLYVALPGARSHGADFARAAVDAGAAGVLTDAEGRARLAEQGLDLATAPVLDGLTGAERFFYAYAALWRSTAREQELINRLAGDPRRLGARRGANTQIGVDHRRIPQQQVALSGRSSTVGDRTHGATDQALRQLGRIGDGRRAEDEHRVGAVETADPA